MIIPLSYAKLSLIQGLHYLDDFIMFQEELAQNEGNYNLSAVPEINEYVQKLADATYDGDLLVRYYQLLSTNFTEIDVQINSSDHQ